MMRMNLVARAAGAAPAAAARVVAAMGPAAAALAALPFLQGATLESAPLSALVLSFFAYGFIGWVWESTVCAMLNQGHFANSGFLLGPCCPIYGVGGVTCWLVARGIEDPAAQFVVAALLCSVIEYAVGLLLEATTHARFWDYTDKPFNIHGRVCLYGAMLFGAGATLICRVIQPALLELMGLLPAAVVIALAGVALAVTAVDAAASLASWRRLSTQLDTVRSDLADRINDSLRETSDSLLERIPDAALDSAQTAHARGRALNAWLAEASDDALEALRERAEMPAFISDGAASLRMAARRLAEAAPRPMPAPPRLERLSRPLPKIQLRRRDLRFFNAFPKLTMKPYEGVIRATGLRDRARELFGRRR